MPFVSQTHTIHPPVYTLCFRWSFSVHTHTYTHTHCKSLQQISSVGFCPCLWRMTMWDFLDLLSCFLLQCCSSFHYTIICARIPVTSTQFRSTFQSICLCLCSMDFFFFLSIASYWSFVSYYIFFLLSFWKYRHLSSWLSVLGLVLTSLTGSLPDTVCSVDQCRSHCWRILFSSVLCSMERSSTTSLWCHRNVRDV